MSSDHSLPPLETLLAHRAWVRFLARRLANDAVDADDLEQDAWLAAAAALPHDGVGIRAWFAKVMRNRAAESRRLDGHRCAREAVVARPEGARSGSDLVIDAEAHARVVQAVLALDEPYRETVLIRFYEGLRPREVATRMGVPVDTVRTRLRRAAELLRVALGSRRDDWLGALAPLLDLRRGAPLATAATVTGGVVMTKASVAVIAIVVGLAAGVLLDRGLVSAPLRESGGDSAAAAPPPKSAPNAGRARATTSTEGADAAVAPAATVPSTTAATSNDAAVRAQVMKALDALDGNWRKTYAAGLDLAKLDSAIVIAVLRERWKEIKEPGDRQQIIKAFSRPPAAANLLDVLDLGMSDPSVPVQNSAIFFLREYAGRDFSADWNSYAAWHADNAGKTPDAVLPSTVRQLADRIRAATPEEMARLVALVDDVDRVARPEDLVLGGLPDALDPWISRLSAKELSAVFFTLSRARVGEDNLRRNVVPLLASSDPERRSAAFRALGEPRNTWAVDLLLPYLRDADARVVRAAADALASIGDARAIEPLLELLRSHASPDHVDAAAGALSNITGVKWDGAHDAAWWDAWWAKNRERFQAPR